MDFLYILLPVYSLSMLCACLTFVHMLQLSSYQTPGYRRWLSGRAGGVFGKLVPAALAPVCLLAGEDWAALVAAGLFALLALLNAPARRAKKPLAYTARVWRLLTAVALLTILVAAIAACLPPLWALVTMAAAYLFLPILACLANILTFPVQKMVNNGYIRDARRILRAHPHLVIIGVTGSYGKTSAKYFLTHFLSQTYNTLMTPESYNTPMGIVRTVREQLRATHDVFVCEMGARHVGDIRELCDIVHPKYGMITSIGPQHLETFFTLENIISTKFELIDALPEDGLAFLNRGNPHIAGHTPGKPAVSYGVDGDFDYGAYDLRVDSRGCHFTLRARGEPYAFQTPLIGRHNVENITGAVAAAHTLGVPMPKIQAAARTLKPVPHRLELTRAPGLTIIDDAFNANPAGAAAALDALSLFDGMKILITPGFVELGARQEECNQTLGQQAAAVCDFVCLVGREQTKSIHAGLLEAGLPDNCTAVCATFDEAMGIARMLDAAGREKFVLLENDLPDNY